MTGNMMLAEIVPIIFAVPNAEKIVRQAIKCDREQ